MCRCRKPWECSKLFVGNFFGRNEAEERKQNCWFIQMSSLISHICEGKHLGFGITLFRGWIVIAQHFPWLQHVVNVNTFTFWNAQVPSVHRTTLFSMARTETFFAQKSSLYSCRFSRKIFGWNDNSILEMLSFLAVTLKFSSLPPIQIQHWINPFESYWGHFRKLFKKEASTPLVCHGEMSFKFCVWCESVLSEVNYVKRMVERMTPSAGVMWFPFVNWVKRRWRRKVDNWAEETDKRLLFIIKWYFFLIILFSLPQTSSSLSSSWGGRSRKSASYNEHSESFFFVVTLKNPFEVCTSLQKWCVRLHL